MEHKKINPFETGSANYLSSRPVYPQSLVDYLANQCDRHSLALDVGCGNGQLSYLLASRFQKIIATDLSAEQISCAIPQERVIYKCAAAEHISADISDVDLIVAAQSAHWFNLTKFYSEVSRVSRAGTVLALVSYGVPVIEGDVGRIFNEFYWGDLHNLWPREREQVESCYRDIYFPFQEIAMPYIVIERKWTLSDLMGYVDSWSAVQLASEKHHVDIVSSFKEVIAKSWGNPNTSYSITWPINGRITKL